LFPDVRHALKEPNGLLAAGGDLSPQRLINAYHRGIFPWYNKDPQEIFLPDPILWWCPNPRSVLYLDNLKVSRSLKKNLRNGGFKVSFDNDFEAVINHCAAERSYTSGTWIHPEMISAYSELARMGYAHSVECWFENELVGGLYGVQIGAMFFGESMFSLKSNSSKIALVYLCSYLKTQGLTMIDCQIKNSHLASLGAIDIALDLFLEHLALVTQQEMTKNWPREKHNPIDMYFKAYG
jgi:leucyl/phenylalanyl-tRNA---protein transferase